MTRVPERATARDVGTGVPGPLEPPGAVSRPAPATGSGRGQDEGAATVLVLALAVVLVLVGAVLIAAGTAVLARHKAQSAADLGALAAAQRAIDGRGGACSAAGSVVRAVGARLGECGFVGADALVTVEVDLPGRLRPLGPARGSARAGPGTR